jgi:WD40 repeat protein
VFEGSLGAFSPNGERLLIAGTSPIVRVLTSLGEPVSLLDGHTAPVSAMAFMGDGRVVTASRDGSARLWDPNNGKLLEVIHAHHGAIGEARFDAARGHLLTVGDGRAKLWSVPIDGRTPDAIGALVDRIAPWTLVDGHLVEKQELAMTAADPARE